MCYYIESMHQLTARSLLLNMPKDRICKKLNKENPDICKLVVIFPHEAVQERSSTRPVGDYLALMQLDEPSFFSHLTDRQKKSIVADYKLGIIHI